MTNKNITDLVTGGAITDSDLFLTRQAATTEDKSITGTQIKTYLGGTITTANQLSSVAAGTVYSLTATPAKIDFGTTDPSFVVNRAGTYLIGYDAVINYNAATFAAVRDVITKVRRTNNTAADLTGSVRTMKTDIITTLTYTMVAISGSFLYTTANIDDALELWGSVSAVPTAGSLDVVSATLWAIRLQQ